VAIAGGGRGEREDGDAGQEHPAPADPVAERGGGQQEGGEGQRVRVDEPLQVGQRRAELGADHRQRGAHHQVVQRDHEGRDADRGQHGGERAGGASGCGGAGGRTAVEVMACSPDRKLLFTDNFETHVSY
jgi:hypothetical protein